MGFTVKCPGCQRTFHVQPPGDRAASPLNGWVLVQLLGCVGIVAAGILALFVHSMVAAKTAVASVLLVGVTQYARYLVNQEGDEQDTD